MCVEHLKKHRNLYSLLFLVLVSIMVAWLFIRVEQLDAEVSKYSNRMSEHTIRTVVTEDVEIGEVIEKVEGE